MSPLRNQPAFRGFARQLLDLHEKIRTGDGDGDAADDIREDLAELWPKLTEPERGLANDLSADLYSLMDEELHLRPDDSAAATHVRDAMQEGQWESVLQHVRQLAPVIEPGMLSYIRARAWWELSVPEVAHAFMQDAAQRDPERINYRLLAMSYLFPLDPSAAAAWALQTYATADSEPISICVASDILWRQFLDASAQDGDDLIPVAERLTRTLQRHGRHLRPPQRVAVEASLEMIRWRLSTFATSLSASLLLPPSVSLPLSTLMTASVPMALAVTRWRESVRTRSTEQPDRDAIIGLERDAAEQASRVLQDVAA